MRGIVELWLGQLHRLLVVWPAWLLTPEGLRAAFAPRMLWRIALILVFAAAISALLQAGLPPNLALIGSGDIVAYVDVVAIAWALGALNALKSAARWAMRRLKRKAQIVARRERRATIRRRRQRRPPPPANDDGSSGERWTVAA